MQANQSPTQTIYASKTPRDLNHDPEPWADESGMRWDSPGDGAWHMPRPEFDHVQHNEPNPILADVRRYVEERSRMNNPKGWLRVLQVFSQAESCGAYITNDWERITSPDHLYHARRVLTRLANLPSATHSATHHAQR